MMRSLHKCLLIVGILLGLMGCSSNSTGPDHGDPPSLPKAQNDQAKPDFSYFQQNNPKVSGNTASGEYSNYYVAQSAALSMTGFFSQADIYKGFISAANAQDASYKDGVWEWKYSYSGSDYGGQSIEIRFTAQSVSDGNKWAMYWTYNSDMGMSFDNYKVMEGTSATDGSSGNWIFNSLTPQTNETVPALKSEWNITSETQKTMSLEVYDSSGSLTGTIDFELDGSANTLTFTSMDSGGGTIIIFWDTNTQTGFFSEDGAKTCWDSNFANTPCS